MNDIREYRNCLFKIRRFSLQDGLTEKSNIVIHVMSQARQLNCGSDIKTTRGIEEEEKFGKGEDRAIFWE